MRYPIDFDKLMSTVSMVADTAYHLTWYVQNYPQQVTACCCLYLVGARFIARLRRS